MLLPTLIVLTVICVIVIYIDGFAYDTGASNKAITASGIFILIAIELFGWLFLGNVVSQKEIYTDITDTVFVIKSPTTAYVEYGDLKASFTDAGNYNAINENTKFQLRTEYNMYGGKCGMSIVIKKEALKTETKAERETP